MRVIVYGSLRQKQGNHHWMTYAALLGEYTLEGYDLYDLGHYPAVVPGTGSIECEVYRISSSILTELDELKKMVRITGVNWFQRRTAVPGFTYISVRWTDW
ncbi:Gamma-glutamylcyclotransferase family protein ytfP [Morganella morganii]|nr:Gamma-glutamylcyclotransferase family protein ytfP [Morganella morganii]STZ23146.1 Gamma-glutamylcyclotransferase family protein ytfP [Morganella morganii]